MASNNSPPMGDPQNLNLGDTYYDDLTMMHHVITGPGQAVPLGGAHTVPANLNTTSIWGGAGSPVSAQKILAQRAIPPGSFTYDTGMKSEAEILHERCEKLEAQNEDLQKSVTALEEKLRSGLHDFENLLDDLRETVRELEERIDNV